MRVGRFSAVVPVGVFALVLTVSGVESANATGTHPSTTGTHSSAAQPSDVGQRLDATDDCTPADVMVPACAKTPKADPGDKGKDGKGKGGKTPGDKGKGKGGKMATGDNNGGIFARTR